jgi:hypothetical protein
MSFKEIVAYYKNLPISFDQMHDLPMRSALGKFFDTTGIKGSEFTPYVQFKLGEKLSDLGITVKAGEEFSPETQQKISDAFFTGDHSNALLADLSKDALPDKRQKIETILQKAKTLALAPAAHVAEEEGSHVGGAGAVGVENTCSTRYAAIGKGLEDISLKLPHSDSAITDLLEMANKNCASAVDLKRLASVLKQLKDGEKLSGADIEFLKNTRKELLNLRSAIKLLGNEDAKNELSPFRSFVRDLGELNDKIAIWDFKGKVPKEIQSAAKDLTKNVGDISFEGKIPAKSFQEFSAFQQKYLSWIRNSIDDPKLTVGEYHDVRKAIRDYKGLLTLMMEKNPSRETNLALQQVTLLSKRLGKFKNGLMATKDGNVTKKLLEQNTQFDADSKKDIEKFLHAIGYHDAD